MDDDMIEEETTAPSEVTRLLQELGQRADAADELLPLVYENLQSIARARLRTERPGHTLQATALVHEAYVRLVGGQSISWQHRAHFFGVAAEAMRRVLVDHARRHRSQKRGGGRRWVPLADLDLAADNDVEEVLALDDALTALDAEDERAARIVKLRFYAGLSVDQTAEALGISPRTVAREWAFARARLFELLGYEGPPES
jgi:RNA polymerase sigma factor (TIGR02999 family)